MKEKLVKYLKGTAEALLKLAKEIDAGEFDKENEELLMKIGADLLFHAKSYTFRIPPTTSTEKGV